MKDGWLINLSALSLGPLVGMTPTWDVQDANVSDVFIMQFNQNSNQEFTGPRRLEFPFSCQPRLVKTCPARAKASTD